MRIVPRRSGVAPGVAELPSCAASANPCGGNGRRACRLRARLAAQAGARRANLLDCGRGAFRAAGNWACSLAGVGKIRADQPSRGTEARGPLRQRARDRPLREIRLPPVRRARRLLRGRRNRPAIREDSGFGPGAEDERSGQPAGLAFESANLPCAGGPHKSALFVGSSMSSSLPAHLKRIEAEAIHIMREVVAEMRNPVMLYSIGKDSSVMLHVAMKAFHPAKPPFPLLHVDTTWKFREMIAFRDETARRLGLKLIVHVNKDGLWRGVSPIASGSQVHTQVMKTEALRQALDIGRFDAAFGGARRDEEKSRAKERIFSHRSAAHSWDPRNQRPELWRLFNTRIREGESMRVFPLSNWTELDVWEYVQAERIPVVPLYFSKVRPVVERSGALIMVDDDRLPLNPGETPRMMRVRFRTLGCYPLTGAIPSDAETLDDIIAEMRAATTSERQGRLIDTDEAASMEKKKREGYF